MATSHINMPSTRYTCRCKRLGILLICMHTTLQPSFPDIFWEPLDEVRIVDRGLLADPSKRHLLSAAQKVKHLTPAIGTEILGVDLRQLSVPQKDELWVLNQLPTNSLLKLATSALLVAERGVVCMCPTLYTFLATR
jgi:hypothetical protein